ncbi:MAG: hypothetical protein ACPKQO_02150 [Nitrososphaeraceae archaeon]
MSKTKIGVFSALMFGVMMLLIPATSIASAAEYDKYYKEKDRYGKDYGNGYDNKKTDESYKKIDKRYYDDYRKVDDRKSYYEEPYKKNDKKSDGPVIIVDNKIPIPHHEKKEKKMKEPPMVLVTKEVLFCDTIASGDEPFCQGEVIPGPNSDRYVTQCSSEQCEDIDDSSFEIKVENANIFEGDEDGTKLNFNGERFTVTEENSNAVETFLVGFFPGFSLEIELLCQESGFDSSYVYGTRGNGIGITPVISCVQFEGDCSGIVQYGEQKECTVKNYVISVEEEI